MQGHVNCLNRTLIFGACIYAWASIGFYVFWFKSPNYVVFPCEPMGICFFMCSGENFPCHKNVHDLNTVSLIHCSREGHVSCLNWTESLAAANQLFGFTGLHKMGKCKGCGKLGRMVSKDGFVSAYHSALLLCPIVSVWDCAVRKMRYSFRPEWV